MLMHTPLTCKFNTIPVHAANQKELNKIVGTNVKALQVATGLTQKEFLEIVGFDQKYPASYFQKISRGEIGISLFNLLIIQKTFQVSLEDLITQKGL